MPLRARKVVAEPAADATPAARAAPGRDRPAPRRRASSSPSIGPIVKATDLGSVQVLKQGNLYLLTDPFGDVHPDTRGLGLYDSDTRRLSCSIAARERRAAGAAPGLGRRQLPRRRSSSTNPRLERNLADKIRPGGRPRRRRSWASRASACSPAAMLEERVRIVNYAEVRRAGRGELELAADAADIFEVRGWTRGRARPPAADRGAAGPAHVPLRRPGRARARRPTSRSPSRPRPSRRSIPTEAGSATAGWIRLTLALGPGAPARRASCAG